MANASGDVVQSNEYYPFGLLMATSTNVDKQPYKYGNKELDSYNGLNWYDFEARYLDSSVPGFMTPDPLAEKYYSISPYVYCFNNPLRFIDPDGRDPGDKFKTKMGAVNDFAKYYNGSSIKRNKEFGSTIYKNKNGTYSYNVARIGTAGNTGVNNKIPEKAKREGAIHTHGADDPRWGDLTYQFSDEDKRIAEKYGQNEYVVLPSAEILEYDVETGETVVPKGVDNDIPSDPNSKERRVNDIDPKETNPHYIIIDHNPNKYPYLFEKEFNNPNEKK